MATARLEGGEAQGSAPKRYGERENPNGLEQPAPAPTPRLLTSKIRATGKTPKHQVSVPRAVIKLQSNLTMVASPKASSSRKGMRHGQTTRLGHTYLAPAA